MKLRIHNKRLPAYGLLAGILALLASTQAPAETIGEKVQRTGVLTAGVWKDLKPFGYVDAKGQWVGYGVDLVHIIQDRLQTALKKPIKLELVAIDADNRFDLVSQGKVDVACGATAFSWQRERLVDFSISVFVDGLRFMTRSNTVLAQASDLDGKRVGVPANTSVTAVVKRLAPKAKLVEVKDIAAGWAKLQSGDIDVLADHGLLLSVLRADAAKPADWKLVPDEPITRESYACMVPENDSRWRDFVNHALLRAIQGYVVGDPEFTAMYQGWFGPQGVAPYPAELLKRHFQGVIDTTARLHHSVY